MKLVKRFIYYRSKNRLGKVSVLINKPFIVSLHQTRLSLLYFYLKLPNNIFSIGIHKAQYVYILFKISFLLSVKNCFSLLYNNNDDVG